MNIRRINLTGLIVPHMRCTSSPSGFRFQLACSIWLRPSQARHSGPAIVCGTASTRVLGFTSRFHWLSSPFRSTLTLIGTNFFSVPSFAAALAPLAASFVSMSSVAVTEEPESRASHYNLSSALHCFLGYISTRFPCDDTA
jgi:hypothetical protein